MALTMWRNTANGDRLDRAELARFQERAHVLYRTNPHIFEDERDALIALGVVPIAAGLDRLADGVSGEVNDGSETVASPASCRLTTSVLRFLCGAVT